MTPNIDKNWRENASRGNENGVNLKAEEPHFKQSYADRARPTRSVICFI
jgi:hypothetical protein